MQLPWQSSRLKKQTEEEAQELHLTASMDSIVSMDFEGKIREFNPAAEKIFGYERSEVIGKQLADIIIPPRLCEAHSKGLAHYLVSGEQKVMDRLELPAVKKKMAQFPAELTITRMTTMEPPMFTGFIRDITDRKRIEVERVKLLADEAMAKQRLQVQFKVMSVLVEAKTLKDATIGIFFVSLQRI